MTFDEGWPGRRGQGVTFASGDASAGGYPSAKALVEWRNVMNLTRHMTQIEARMAEQSVGL
jgi:hypothetical protein